MADGQPDSVTEPGLSPTHHIPPEPVAAPSVNVGVAHRMLQAPVI